MIKDRANEFLREAYSLPLSKNDLERFARQILVDFVKELESKKTTVKWNYGLDEVVFLKKIEELKELYELSDDQSDSDVSHGTGITGSDQGD